MFGDFYFNTSSSKTLPYKYVVDIRREEQNSKIVPQTNCWLFMKVNMAVNLNNLKKLTLFASCFTNMDCSVNMQHDWQVESISESSDCLNQVFFLFVCLFLKLVLSK